MARAPKRKSAQRKGWDSLSPSYRRRLERGGVTRARYEAGEKLSGARGHAATPERPERAIRNPDQYHKYLQRRNRGIKIGDRVPRDKVFEAAQLGIVNVWPWFLTLSPGDQQIMSEYYVDAFMKQGKASPEDIELRMEALDYIDYLGEENDFVSMGRENWKAYRIEYMTHFGKRGS